MDAFVSWKFFFEKHLILDVKTTLRLQKPYWDNFWWRNIKNEGCKCYLGNEDQKGMFLVVSQLDVHFDFGHSFFGRPIGRASKIARPKNGAPRKKFVRPWLKLSIPLTLDL